LVRFRCDECREEDVVLDAAPFVADVVASAEGQA
jgi:hypothetical protein